MKPYSIGIVYCDCVSNPQQLGTQIRQDHVKMIWASNRTLEQQCREQYPAAELVASKDQMVEDGAISLVVLCNPGPEDHTLIGRLVKANKNVRVLHG